MAIAYLARWTVCVLDVCVCVWLSACSFYSLESFTSALLSLRAPSWRYSCSPPRILQQNCQTFVGRFALMCAGRHSLPRYASNVVVTIHRASSPWNGWSAQRQVGKHSYIIYIQSFSFVCMSSSCCTPTGRVPPTPDRTSVGRKRRY